MKQQQILHVNAIWFPCEDRSTNKQLTGNSALVRTTSWSCCLETYGGTPFCSSESRIECSLIQYPARSSPTLATLQTSTHLLYLKLVLIFMCIYIINYIILYWLVVSTLWKIWVRQLGSLFPTYGKIQFMFQTTNQIIIIFPLLLVYSLLTTINHHYITITLSHSFWRFPSRPQNAPNRLGEVLQDAGAGGVIHGRGHSSWRGWRRRAQLGPWDVGRNRCVF